MVSLQTREEACVCVCVREECLVREWREVFVQGILYCFGIYSFVYISCSLLMGGVC